MPAPEAWTLMIVLHVVGSAAGLEAHLSGTEIFSLNSPASKGESDGPCTCASTSRIELPTGIADIPGGGCRSSLFNSLAMREARAIPPQCVLRQRRETAKLRCKTITNWDVRLSLNVRPQAVQLAGDSCAAGAAVVQLQMEEVPSGLLRIYSAH